MKKPVKKDFMREHGPRGHAKYIAAMAKYRKSQKTETKTATQPKQEKKKEPAKTTGMGPVASGAEYGRALQKQRQKANPQPKAEVKPKTETKAPTPKPRQTTPEEARSRFFRSSSGTYGQNMPSNPALKSQPKKPKRSDFATGRTGTAKYQAALRRYNNRTKGTNRTSLKPKVNRRGRRVWPVPNGK